MAIDDGTDDKLWDEEMILLGVRIEKGVKAKLQKMADIEKRSMAMQVEYLIEKAYEMGEYDEDR